MKDEKMSETEEEKGENDIKKQTWGVKKNEKRHKYDDNE